ncbi:DMT family transporter [Vibrio vulnificus]|jgi:drug/metabolite transporter (DMT)-like permease|uniref:DMT family transporter n=1 Tax=Vibrio vulnificus TaxID=672 RepID=UPI0006AD56E7|nr:DMT family transporter [Vibrio vulnificus]EGQ7928432.1 DMT family transporter [Vibrio vulnificus]EGQ8085981.1 DMT family transporter [Vibrio vulnificus]EGQ9282027.1 DMT family transporter [Vibrio vulnificus]EGR0061546.1 DMT family transporter [Vibrio vulnificus]EGR0750656.1 DMT family transporter [Vibrio vulnificus]
MLSNLKSAFPLGVRYMILSALGFALMSASVKYVSVHGIPLFEIVAARALVSLIISYLDVKRKGISVWGNNKRWLFARGAVGTLALMCVYYAVTALPLAEATILQYVHPVFTALLAVLFLKERVQPATLACIVLCLLGVFTMVYPSFDASGVGELPMLSVGIALLGAFGSSIAYVIVRKLSRTEDSSVIIFYFPLVALPVSAMLIGDDFVVPDVALILVLILVGIFTQIGQFGLTKAMQTQTAGNASAYSYVQIVFSALLGVVLFNEVPSIWTLLGGSLIVIGALINVFGPKSKWLANR